MIILFRKLSLSVVLIFGIGLSISYAQVQATNGSIQGDVVDSGGAFVPGADVEADAVDTGTVHKSDVLRR